MNISGSTPVNTSYQDSDKANPFQALGSALQSGDIGAAQKAFGDLQAKFQARKAQDGQTATTGTKGGNSNWQTLSDALKSGDLAGAQKAFQAMGQGRMGALHHHHKIAAGAESATPAEASPATGSATVDLSA